MTDYSPSQVLDNLEVNVALSANRSAQARPARGADDDAGADTDAGAGPDADAGTDADAVGGADAGADVDEGNGVATGGDDASSLRALGLDWENGGAAALERMEAEMGGVDVVLAADVIYDITVVPHLVEVGIQPIPMLLKVSLPARASVQAQFIE